MKILLLTLLMLVSAAKCRIKRFQLGESKKIYSERSVIGAVKNHSIKTLWFDQELDHFNDVNSVKWKQKFYSMDQYYKKGGPIFLMLGGEGPASEKWMRTGAWVEIYAKYLHAMCFQIEHRYYGDSHPVEDLSVENLQYLSSEQALADAASFIMNRTEEMGLDIRNTRWFTFGGSYSGALSAWMKRKYPHLVYASVASSAPVEAQLNFKSYVDNVIYAMNTVSETCVNNVAQAVQQIDETLSSNDGKQTITEKFRLDPPLDPATDSNDMANFYETLSGNFDDVVQYNRDNREGPLSSVTVDTLCALMDNNTLGEPIDRYAAVNDLVMKQTNQSTLDITYKSMIDSMRNISWDSDTAAGGRQWTYQTCTEFGYYQTSDSNQHPFSRKFPLSFFTQQCGEIYDGLNLETIERGIEWSLTNYGGLNIKSDRIVFINGAIDPWHLLSLYNKTEFPENYLIFIPDTAHCADMYSPADTDSQGLSEARSQILFMLGSWLSE